MNEVTRFAIRTTGTALMATGALMLCSEGILAAVQSDTPVTSGSSVQVSDSICKEMGEDFEVVRRELLKGHSEEYVHQVNAACIVKEMK